MWQRQRSEVVRAWYESVRICTGEETQRNRRYWKSSVWIQTRKVNHRLKTKLYHIFIDLEKAFDRVPRKVIEWALRRKMVLKRMVKAIIALYIETKTRLKKVAGV